MRATLALSLMSQRRFLPVWMAQTFGAFNDNLLRWSLVVLAAYEGFTVFGLPRQEMAPIAAVVFTLPLFLFSPIAGQFVDTLDRMKVMRAMKLLEIALMSIAALGFILDQPLLLLVALFLMGVQSAFFNPARQASMPTLLTADELVTGNGLISGAVNVAILVAAILASLLVGQDNGVTVISGLLIGFAIIGWLGLMWGVEAPASAERKPVNLNIIGETWRIVRFMLQAPNVLRPMLGVAWFWTVAAALITLVPVFARDVLAGDTSVVALFQLLFTVSTALGALTAGLLDRGNEARPAVIIGALGMALCSAYLGVQTLPMQAQPDAELMNAAQFIAEPSYWPIMAAMSASAVCGGLFLVPLQAMVQRRSDPERRGRLLAGGGMINGLGATVGPLTLVVFARLDMPMQSTFFMAAAGMALIGLVVTFRGQSKS